MPRSKTTAWAVAVGAVLAIAAGVAVVVVRLGGDSLAPGFVADGTSGTEATHEAEVRLPIGVVRLASGAPRDEIAARRVGRGGDGTVEAADDAAIVGVSWSFQPSLGYDDLLTHPAAFSLAVTAGGESTDLGEQDVDLHDAVESGLLPEQSLIAVVAGDGDDLGFAVTYEGRTQHVDMASGEVDAGAAAALYPDGPQTYGTREDCDPRSAADPEQVRYVSRADGFLHCRVEQLVRTPYLPDLGWAEAGRVWQVVELTVTTPRRVRWLLTGARYRVDRGPVTVTLGSGEAVRAPRSPGDGRATVRGSWVFDGPADESAPELHVSAPMTARRPPGETRGPARIALGVDQTFTLRR